MTIQQILKQYWGHSSFRPLQEDIIRAVLNGKDTLALLPTGGGKSVCYQVPAMASDGICIVISPLIALMKDQVQNLQKRNIKAAALVSGMSYRELDVTLDNCIYGDYKFLYLSPERLQTELFLARFQKMRVSLIAVDEAHCISQWGHDFRPPYRQIAAIRNYFPQVPLLALTATATQQVQDDICTQLDFKNHAVYTGSFARANITYAVVEEENKLQRMATVFKNVRGCGVVYVRNRRRTQEISDWLNRNGITSTFYHAGLPREERTKRQEEWMNNAVRIMVATNAFGMGIDKPDVRAVVHYDLPDNIESYYQEAGRAGRDGKSAYAVALYNVTDIEELKKRALTAIPSRELLVRVYQAIANYLQVPFNGGQGQSYDFDITVFAARYKLQPLQVLNCIRYLELENYLSLSDGFFIPSRIHFELKHTDLYKFQVENVKFDHLIKTILRSYDGAFDRFIDIYENDLARRANISVEETVKQLQTLQKLQVITYEEQTDKPQLIFTQPRLEESHLHFNPAVLEERLQRIKYNGEKLIRYISNKHHCRSMMLLEYFGERSEQRCGTCDYCRLRNKLELNDVEYETISERIAKEIGSAAITPGKLVENMAPINSGKINKVVQWMLDNGQLTIDSNSRLLLSQ